VIEGPSDQVNGFMEYFKKLRKTRRHVRHDVTKKS